MSNQDLGASLMRFTLYTVELKARAEKAESERDALVSFNEAINRTLDVWKDQVSRVAAERDALKSDLAVTKALHLAEMEAAVSAESDALRAVAKQLKEALEPLGPVYYPGRDGRDTEADENRKKAALAAAKAVGL